MGAIIFLLLVSAGVLALVNGVQKAKKKNIQNQVSEEVKIAEPAISEEKPEKAKKVKAKKSSKVK